jgi:hypothetical protein
LKTRTTAQIRSHAQKYIIKLCNKYQIRLKSKKFRKRYPNQLETLKKKKSGNTFEMDKVDKELLNIFNYYIRVYKPFKIEKVYKDSSKLENGICSHTRRNRRTERLIKNKIFDIKKIKKEQNPFVSINSHIILEHLNKLKEDNDHFQNVLFSGSFSYDDNVFNILNFFQKTENKLFSCNDNTENSLMLIKDYVNILNINYDCWNKQINEIRNNFEVLINNIEMADINSNNFN